MRRYIQRPADAGLLICAVLLLVVAVRREFLDRPNPSMPASGAATEPILYEDWRDFQRTGTVMGSETAPVQIIEFSDLQCPFCARFHNETLPSIQTEFGYKVALTFVHFPLNSHPFARKAAIAAECAKREQRFGEIISLFFRAQDSIGIKAWELYAAEAGVRDLESFTQCLDHPDVTRGVNTNRELARSLGIRGTPGIMLNGWYFPGGISGDSLSRMIRRVVERGAVLEEPR